MNYYDLANNEKVKLELLDTLASLLSMNEQDRIRMGVEKSGRSNTENGRKSERIRK